MAGGQPVDLEWADLTRNEQRARAAAAAEARPNQQQVGVPACALALLAHRPAPTSRPPRHAPPAVLLLRRHEDNRG